MLCPLSLADVSNQAVTFSSTQKLTNCMDKLININEQECHSFNYLILFITDTDDPLH